MYFTDLSMLAGCNYDIVYADPPWAYNDKMRGHSFSLDHEYETQSKDWIVRLPIQSIMARDAVLFLWAVSPQLPEAIQVITAWGFKYKTVAFVWSKETATGKDVANLGRWTMGNVEMYLLGTRGHPQRETRNVRQLIRAPRHANAGGKVHSVKPLDAACRIVTLMGNKPRIELFARGDAEDGWDRWGNEPDFEEDTRVAIERS